MLSFQEDTRTSITGAVAAAIYPANNASLAEKALRQTGCLNSFMPEGILLSNKWRNQ